MCILLNFSNMRFVDSLWFIVILLINSEPSSSLPSAKRLFADLMHGYQKLRRPVSTAMSQLDVGLKLKLSQIVDLSERHQILTTIVWVDQTWHDVSLHWDPEEYDNITYLYLPSDMIWTPDIVLYNNANGASNITICTKATVHSDGSVVWQPPAIFESMCMIDVEWFPFDIQECELRFGSWSYAENLLNLFHIDEDNVSVQTEFFDEQLESLQNMTILETGIDLTEYFPSVEWDILQIPAVRRRKAYSSTFITDRYFIDITYKLVLRRKPLYYMVNVLLPCLGISCCTILVFYLPAASGEKVGLSISVLVSVTVFFLLLIDIVPASSIVLPLIGKYLLFTMIMVTLSVLLTVFSLNFYHRSPSMHNMPEWLRYWFLVRLPPILKMQKRTLDVRGKSYRTMESVNDDVEEPMVFHQALHGKHVLHYHSIPFGTFPRQAPILNPRPGSVSSVDNMRKGILKTESTTKSRLQTEKEILIRELNEEKLKMKAKRRLYYSAPILKTFENVGSIAEFLKQKDAEEKIIEDWRYISMVFDRLCLFVFTFLISAGTAYLFLTTPTLWDNRLPVMDRYQPSYVQLQDQ